MNTTKGLFSELVYDFQSVRWNEFEEQRLGGFHQIAPASLKLK